MKQRNGWDSDAVDGDGFEGNDDKGKSDEIAYEKTLLFAGIGTALMDTQKSKVRAKNGGANADYSPYYGKDIIALDACTVLSKKVNCIVVED